MSSSIILRDVNIILGLTSSLVSQHPVAFPLSFKYSHVLCEHEPVLPPKHQSTVALNVSSDCHLSPQASVPSFIDPAVCPQTFSLILDSACHLWLASPQAQPLNSPSTNAPGLGCSWPSTHLLTTPLGDPTLQKNQHSSVMLPGNIRQSQAVQPQLCPNERWSIELQGSSPLLSCTQSFSLYLSLVQLSHSQEIISTPISLSRPTFKKKFQLYWDMINI